VPANPVGDVDGLVGGVDADVDVGAEDELALGDEAEVGDQLPVARPIDDPTERTTDFMAASATVWLSTDARTCAFASRDLTRPSVASSCSRSPGNTLRRNLAPLTPRSETRVA